ncbi:MULTISPECIES: hypothetical protein [unclassified Streptomyces]|uniref:hypothetical protein n=1 Tax=unclassified Streptomyces TaxID=2593676 RepID=UPI000DC3881F|nr:MULTISPECIES: hypothetical protein [unclassified Streptomyces]MYT73309.1 hypothetical protein [Streptomyces sp. SID8367]RAJ74909.1 hypothetical protein K377_06676 [Streptomyces sp. PsTaAH-137]
MTRGTESDEELTARFRSQGRQRVAADRRRDAGRARRAHVTIAAAVALVALVLTAVRLGQDGEAGAWTALYLTGGVVAGCGVPLARAGRTRWALAAMCLGAALASLGDAV